MNGSLAPQSCHAWKVGTGMEGWDRKGWDRMEGLDRQTAAWCHSHAWKRMKGATAHGRCHRHAWTLGPVNGSLVPQSCTEGCMEGWDRQTVAWCHSHAWDSQAWKVGTGERQLGATRPANGSLVQVWTGKRQLGATVTHGRLGPANGSSVPRTANGSSVPRTEVWDRSKRCHSHAWKVGTRMEGWDR